MTLSTPEEEHKCTTARFRPRSLQVAEIRVDAVTREDLLHLFSRARAGSQPELIFNHNLHSLYLYGTNAAFRAPYAKATVVHIDGMPVVWVCRAAGLPVSSAHRVTLLDAFESVLSQAAAEGARVFYLGSTAKVVEQGLHTLRERHPHLIIEARDGHFDKTTESSAVIEQIQSFRPDILFVGMGMPIQELWLAEHVSRIHVPAIVTCGATLDYVVGAAYKPPAWAGPLGLYGVFRLFSDPRRLWRRYLLEPLWLAGYLGWAIFRQRLLHSRRG